jgi:hypothetical protein
VEAREASEAGSREGGLGMELEASAEVGGEAGVNDSFFAYVPVCAMNVFFSRRKM